MMNLPRFSIFPLGNVMIHNLSSSVSNYQWKHASV